MNSPPFSGISAEFRIRTLNIIVPVMVDSPVVKKRLLHDIVETMKKGEDPIQECRNFLWILQDSLEAYGNDRTYDITSEEPDFGSLGDELEKAMSSLNCLWSVAFPDGAPQQIEFPLNIELTFEKLTRGLAFAWSEEWLQGDGVTEITSEQISANDVIYWTVFGYIYIGEMDLDDAAFYEEPYRACESVVKNWFGFLERTWDYETSWTI